MSMSDEAQVIEFIPRQEMEQELEKLGGDPRLKTQKTFSRQAVVNAFEQAFELIGGVPRLAMWADEHPTEFFRIYSKLLPSQSDKTLSGTTTQRIIHVLPRGPLDE
jgi:hypothetical protein